MIKQLALDLPPSEPLHSFATFFLGENTAAVEAIAALCSAPCAPPHGAAYIFGKGGSGKTHLLHAACAELIENGQQALYLGAHTDAGDWPVDPHTLTLCDNTWQLAVLDDVHLFDAAKQRAAFMLYEDAIARGVSIIASAAMPALALAVREDLRTRMAWGTSWALTPLNDEDKLLALRSAASARGFMFPDELARWVMTHCSRDMSALMNLVERVDRYSLGAKRSVTLPLLKAMLGEEVT